jgi:hypothetical protein
VPASRRLALAVVRAAEVAPTADRKAAPNHRGRVVVQRARPKKAFSPVPVAAVVPLVLLAAALAHKVVLPAAAVQQGGKLAAGPRVAGGVVLRVQAAAHRVAAELPVAVAAPRVAAERPGAAGDP